MCLLCVMEPGSTPTREQLLTATDSNPHGYGYAFMTNDKILTGRGMDATEMVDRFLRIRKGMPDTWAMFHARFTTHGETSKGNCHPFRVAGNENIVLAHNGVLPIDVPKGDRRSDTRIFAEEYLPEIGVEYLDDPEFRALMESWMGGSKVAVFSIDPALESNVYILNEDLGHWSDGIWWSNYGYRKSAYMGYPKSSYSSAWDPDDASLSYRNYWLKDKLCMICVAELTDEEAEYAYCSNCYMCLECYEDMGDCLCYRPSNSKPSWRIHAASQDSLYAYVDSEEV